MKNYLFIILGCILFISCESFFETTLELEEPAFEQQLNVNAILQNLNEEQKILVSKTIGLNEKLDSSLVNGAIVEIVYPDDSKCLMENIENQFGYIRQNYFGNCEGFIAEEAYQINVMVPGENLKASATAIMPMTVSFSEVVYLEDGGLNNDGDEVSAIDLMINDPLGVENYYKFELFNKIFNQFYYLESNDALAIESANYSAIILSDDQFDGEDYKLRLQFYDYSYDNQMYKSEFYIIASTISKDQYLFDKKLRQFKDNNDNPFASATQLHDNIEGGLGIFAIENSTIIKAE